VDHVAPLERSFPWRGAALVALVVAAVELMALLALAGVRLVPPLHTAQAPAATPATTPAAHSKPATHPKTTPAHKPAVVRATPLRAHSRLSVLVLNGNGITHAAANEAAGLLRRGYRAASSADAPNHDYTRSLVLFAPGYAREGRRLAHELGVKIVGPLDGMTPAELKGSQLVVILGDS
jgi:hypothetical protein